MFELTLHRMIIIILIVLSMYLSITTLQLYYKLKWWYNKGQDSINDKSNKISVTAANVEDHKPNKGSDLVAWINIISLPILISLFLISRR